MSRRTLLTCGVGLLAAAAIPTLSACQPAGSTAESAPADPTAIPTWTPDVQSSASEFAANFAIERVAPLPLSDASPPVALEIAALDLQVDVLPMEWDIVYENGQRTTQWRVPEAAAGWHSDSAGAGAAANVIISGRQQGEAAIFAPLALGLVERGQWVNLRAGSGHTFVYQISEVVEPIAVDGATSAQNARLAELYSVGDQARLTLITGWPAFTTTHRLFVVADYKGIMAS